MFLEKGIVIKIFPFVFQMTTSLPTGVTMECSDENLTKVLEGTEKSKESFKFNITATEKVISV